MISDDLGRQFKTLRLSLTSACNMACVYCVGHNGHQKKSALISARLGTEFLTPENYQLIVSRLHQILNLESVRLTGGEPTLYKSLVQLVGLLKETGVPKVEMTTNGIFLEDIVNDLKTAGLDSLNVSLDTLDPDIFKRLNRQGNLQKILEGIEKSVQGGIETKINCTVMRSYNEGEILPLLNYAFNLGIVIRFLELMKMGPLYQNASFPDYFFSEAEILAEIGKRYQYHPLTRQKSATAHYYLAEAGKKFGVIANETAPFCRDCDRLRLDSRGILYGCLSVNQGFPVGPGISNDDLEYLLRQALGQKQRDRFHGSPLSMIAIGG